VPGYRQTRPGKNDSAPKLPREGLCSDTRKKVSNSPRQCQRPMMSDPKANQVHVAFVRQGFGGGGENLGFLERAPPVSCQPLYGRRAAQKSIQGALIGRFPHDRCRQGRAPNHMKGGANRESRSAKSGSVEKRSCNRRGRREPLMRKT